MGNGQRDRALRRKAAHDLMAAGTWAVRDIAAVLGVHRDTVYAALRDLETEAESATRQADAADVRRDAADLERVLTTET